MPVDLITEVPADFDDALLIQTLGQEVEAAANINTAWYLQQWELGQDPPCCAKCASVRHVPAGKSTKWRVVTAPLVLARMEASCESIAAMYTGHKRADHIRTAMAAGKSERDAWREAKALYQIQLEDTNDPRYWHVVSLDDGVRHDATEGMSR